MICETISNGYITLSATQQGAEVISIEQDGREYLWQKTAPQWQEQAPILFPIVGGLEDGFYEYDGKRYDMKTHGFARDMKFEIEEKTYTRLSYVLKYNEETLKVYPFRFEFYVIYELVGHTLKVTFVIKNKGENRLAAAVGHHPGYRCPFLNGEKMEDYYLEFECSETISRVLRKNGFGIRKLQDYIIDTNILPLSHDMFKEAVILKTNGKSNWVKLKSDHNNYEIKVDFSEYPYLCLWSSAEPAPFICIEPWNGLPSNVNEDKDIMKKEHMVYVEPGDRYTISYSVDFR
ncbi:aldose 1-epimerase family protein [Lachnospiraceae bacterium ASD3451]|uniref:aldose 1-epimerase family protein n=1 Tax=Diplocloster agilis TaxID=2850323 RepID=UPI001D829E3D|nr:aldose 1-epimerase family protein [Diplocloster agilis]MBU9742958.1 aldose 1-epimerase family protein [Diplocloster agilis]